MGPRCTPSRRPQRLNDAAVQPFGALAANRGVKVEELYREIRALRIYEDLAPCCRGSVQGLTIQRCRPAWCQGAAKLIRLGRPKLIQ